MLEVFVHLIALAAAVWGGNRITAAVLDRIVKPDDNAIEEFRNRGLADGGRYIGYLERFLFYVFITQGSLVAVGFILAAKGILRHSEISGAEQQQVAEYVLIGTMTSLGWALTVALVVRQLLAG